MALKTKQKHLSLTNMDNMEANVRQIVAQLGTEVATRRLVRTTYKERNGLTALSKNEKTGIHFYLDKIVEELIICPVDTPISQLSPQPESFPVKLQRSDMNIPGSNSPDDVSREGHRSESINQTDVSGVHPESADFITSLNSSTEVENDPKMKRDVGNKSNDDQDTFPSNGNGEISRSQQKMKNNNHHHHAKRERKGIQPQSSRNLFDSISQTRHFGRKIVGNCNTSIITSSGEIKSNTVKSKSKFDCSVSLQKVDRFVKIDTDSDSECDPTFKSFKIKRHLSAAAVRKAILDSDSEYDWLTRKQSVIESDSECVQSDMEVVVIESTSKSDQLFIDEKPCKTAAITVGNCEKMSDSEWEDENTGKRHPKGFSCCELENENEDSVLAFRGSKKISSLKGREMNNESDDSEDMCNPTVWSQNDCRKASSAEKRTAMWESWDQYPSRNEMKNNERSASFSTKRRKLDNDEVQLKETPLEHRNLSAADIRRAVLDSDSESHQSDVSSISSCLGNLQTNCLLFDDTDNSPFFNKRKKKRMAALRNSESDSGDTDCNETSMSIDAEETKFSNSVDEANSDEGRSVLQISETESNYQDDENHERPETETDCEDLDMTLVNCEEKASSVERASKDSGIAVEKNQTFCPKHKNLMMVDSNSVEKMSVTKFFGSAYDTGKGTVSSTEEDFEHISNHTRESMDELEDLEHELKHKRKTKNCGSLVEKRKRTSSKRKRSDHGNTVCSSSKRKQSTMASRCESSLSLKSSSFERENYHLHDSCTLSDSDNRRSHQSLLSRRMLESGSEFDLSDISDSNLRSSETDNRNSKKSEMCSSDGESDVSSAAIKKSLGTSDKDESGKENRKKNGPIAKNKNMPNEYGMKHTKQLGALRKICRHIGVIIRNTIELIGCDTPSAKVKRIKNLLKEKGMKGRPSMKSAHQFMLEKELKDLGSAMNAGDDSRSSRSRSRTSYIENTTGMSPDRRTILKEQKYAFSHMRDIFTIDDSSD